MHRYERVPLELLETFVAIADHDGDATAAAAELGVNQPSVSKRLAALRRLTAEPWLILRGKRWGVTPEGERVRGVVSDLVRRHRAAERYVAGGERRSPAVSIACGREAAVGFVGRAVERFLAAYPETPVRLATPRGRERIEGVAGGRFDLAVVSDPPEAIRRAAGMELYVEPLFEDRLVLVANPSREAAWREGWRALPEGEPVRAEALREWPLILPEAGSARRRQFDEWFGRGTGGTPRVALETGGWRTILEFAERGRGVGLSSESAWAAFHRERSTAAVNRPLASLEFPPDEVIIIARKAHGMHEPDLSLIANSLLHGIREMTSNST